ncbi:MAG: hypothetical protein QOH65_1468 [Methylobacteriaceae bacterium]|jgi:hypothetical protein|nr:hypothetical protein [Methylobacteriaceae bacterium]
MRPLLLAVSATALLAIGTALSVQATRPPAPNLPAVPEAVAAAPPPVVNSEIAKPTAQAAAVPVSEPTAASVVRVKTVRIEPERSLGTTEAEQAASAAEVQQQDAATANDQPAIPPAGGRAAALKTVAPQAVTANEEPPPRVRTARAKSPVVTAKGTRAKRKLEQLAGDDAGKESLSYAPKEPGPESLNPLGKLLSGR